MEYFSLPYFFNHFFCHVLFLYLFAPQTKIKILHASLSALFTTVSLQLVSSVLSFFINKLTDYSFIYGSLTAIIILMIWFYLLGFMIIIGGIFNAVLKRRTGHH